MLKVKVKNADAALNYKTMETIHNLDSLDIHHTSMQIIDLQ